MGFQDPLVGGISLRKAAIRSPNYVAGSSGWTINIDGSAEFNNVTIRGGQVVGGTALYYNGTPALGTLIASISATAGTDSFGNHYGVGIISYDEVNFQFSQLQAGKLLVGALSGGVGSAPDTADATVVTTGGNTGVTSFIGSVQGGTSFTDPPEFQLNAGQPSKGTGSGLNPFIRVIDTAGSSDVDVLVSGSVIKAADLGGAATWQTPTYNAGWAAGDVGGILRPLQFRLDAENNLQIAGTMHTTSNTPSTFAFVLPTAYRPTTNQRVGTSGLNTGTNTVLPGYLQVGLNGSTGFFTPAAGGGAANVDVYVSHNFPFGNIA
jgi:hypothetical protein